MTVTDQDGEQLHFKQPFERIVSLYPAHTENLLFIGAAEQLVGIHRSEKKYQATQQKPVFSYRDDTEKFIAAEVDLVLIRPMIKRAYPNFVNHLKRAGIEVFSIQPRGVEEIYAYWKILGRLTGREQQADKMIGSFKEQITSIETEIAKIPLHTRPKVYFEAIHSKMKTFSPQSIAVFCLETAGGINVAADAKARMQTNIAEYGRERILSHAGSIDVFLAQRGRMNPITRDAIISSPGFQAIKAVQKNRVYLIEEALVSRPTPRLLEGIRSIHSLLYGRELTLTSTPRNTRPFSLTE